MMRRNSQFRNMPVPGITVFAIVLFLVFLLCLGCSRRHMRMDVHFDSLYGLQEKDRVYYAGKQVGLVEDIDPGQDGGYLVRLALDNDPGKLPEKFSCLELECDPVADGRKGIVIKRGSGESYELKDGLVVQGGCSSETWADTVQKQFEQGLQVLQDMARNAADSLDSMIKSKQYKQLQQDLKDLAGEIAEAGKMAHDKVVREILPDLEKRLEKMKERLEKYGEQKKIEPMEEQIEKIKKI